MASPVVVRVLPLPNMPVAPILTRLGYREKTADKQPILTKYKALITQYARSLKIRLFYKYKRFSINEGLCDIEGYRFQSQLIRTRFAGVRDVVLMAAGCMPEDDLQIKTYEEQGQLAQAVILDGVLSEKVDWALDFMEKEMSTRLKHQGKTPGMRLSCGYGDFALSHQRYFYEELELGRYGIELTDQFLLVPEKTVTAVLPLKPIG